jgi:hypothetical protein
MRLCRSSFVEAAKAVEASRKLRQTLAMAFFISMSFPFRRHGAAVVRIDPRFPKVGGISYAAKRIAPEAQTEPTRAAPQPPRTA